MSENSTNGDGLTAAERLLNDLWEEHMRYEFATQSTEDTLGTMTADSFINHVPVMTGGVGLEEIGEFYSTHFIPQMPPDTEITPVSRTIGRDQLVDEMVFKFTHNSNGLDAARLGAHRKTSRGPARRDSRLSRRQSVKGTYLLGSGIGPRSTWPHRHRQTAGRRVRDRPKGARSVPAVKYADPAFVLN